MKLELINTVTLGNQQIVAGAQIEIDADRGQAMIDAGDARPVGGDAKAGDAPAVDANLVAAARDLLESDPDKTDKGAWTKSGKPEIKAMEALLGYSVSAAERDAAWAAVNAE